MCNELLWRYVQRGDGWDKVPTPCRKCRSCRANRINDYVGRCLAEAHNSEWAVSVTLTYRNDVCVWPRERGQIPGTRVDMANKIIQPLHFQKWIRALRRRGYKIRYIGCGEMGALRNRVHFHAVLFGMGKKPAWKNNDRDWCATWPHGHIFCDWDVSHKSMRYVCKYTIKSQERDETSWFTLSKKPAIGYQYFQERAMRDAVNGVWPQGFGYQPPRGIKNGGYYMTGATRRDYLRTLRDEMYRLHGKTPFQGSVLNPKTRLNEWVARSYEAVQRYEVRKAYEDAQKRPRCWLRDILDEMGRQSYPLLDRIERRIRWEEYERQQQYGDMGEAAYFAMWDIVDAHNREARKEWQKRDDQSRHVTASAAYLNARIGDDPHSGWLKAFVDCPTTSTRSDPGLVRSRYHLALA